MLTYKTFRWTVHENTAADIDTLLNSLPLGAMIEGYGFTNNEIFITVSIFERYKKETEREVR